MRVSCRMTVLLFEACEAEGIDRHDLVRPLGIDAARLSDKRETTDWATVAAMFEQMSRVVGGDVERLRAIGRQSLWVPSYAAIRRLLRTLASPRLLYEVSERWVAPASLAHLFMLTKFVSETRMVLHGAIPEPHAPSAAFFHVFEGVVIALPTMLSLPPSVLTSARVTPRTVDLVVDLPKSRSLLGAARQLTSRWRRPVRDDGKVAVLEDQREALRDGIESLARVRDELRGVLERLPDMVLIHDTRTIVWVNRTTAKTLEWGSADAMIGLPLTTLLDARSKASFEARLARDPRSSDGDATDEVWVRTRTGGAVRVELAPTQSVVFEGVSSRLVVGRDITDRERLQQRLVSAERLASLGLLAAGVAHEVNNPLGYVLNNIELARRDVAAMGPAASRSHEALGTALEGVDRIRTIVKDLLLLAREDPGETLPTDAMTAVGSTLLLADATIRPVARLVTEFLPVPHVRASPSRLAQIVLNLVANAVEAMPPGRSVANELTVRLHLDDDGARVVLEVEDSGVGIPPADLGRVFDPFFTTKPSGKGTGLGLAITQRLVLDLGGEIGVTSRVGEGSCFRVVLPAAQA